MKLLLYVDEGPGKPGPLGAGGNIRSLSGIVACAKMVSAFTAKN